MRVKEYIYHRMALYTLNCGYAILEEMTGTYKNGRVRPGPAGWEIAGWALVRPARHLNSTL